MSWRSAGIDGCEHVGCCEIDETFMKELDCHHKVSMHIDQIYIVLAGFHHKAIWEGALQGGQPNFERCPKLASSSYS
jgi:hypothetical protein